MIVQRRPFTTTLALAIGVAVAIGLAGQVAASGAQNDGPTDAPASPTADGPRAADETQDDATAPHADPTDPTDPTSDRDGPSDPRDGDDRPASGAAPDDPDSNVSTVPGDRPDPAASPTDRPPGLEGSVNPVPFLPTEPPRTGPSGAERARAWEQLQEAENDLVRLRAEVRRTARQIGELDERLADATSELQDISEVLAAAEDRLATSRATERDAAARLEATQAELTAAVDHFAGDRRRLEDRAIATFKYGASPTADLFVRSVAGAGSWHEVAVAMETVSRLLADDRDLVSTAADRTRTTAALQAEIAQVRVQAVAAAEEASAEQARVEAILAVQAELVAEIETERGERTAALEALEASAAARTVLIADLEARVIELGFTGGHWFVPIEVNLDVHGPAPAWASRLPPAGQQWAAAIDAVASRHGVDGRLMAALVWSESNFNPGVVSHAGALGLAQLMPGTARGLGVDPRDPIANLDGGTRYLRAQLERFGRLDLALAAYNAGPNRVAAVGRVPNIVETQLYVVRVMDRYQMLMGG